MKLVDGLPDAHQRRLAIVEGKAIKPITSADIDGKIGSMLDMRDEHIPEVMDELGRMATALSYHVNELQSQGLDLNGNVGRNLFTDVNSELVAKSRVVTSGNSQADVAVFIDNTNALKGGEYGLKYDGSDYVVTKPSGETVKVTTDSSGSAFYLDGMRVEIRNPPELGEKVLLRPTRSFAAQMQIESNDPKDIAAQSYEASTPFAQGDAEFKILAAGQLREFEVIVSPRGEQFAVTDTKGNVWMQPQPYPPSGPVTVMGTTFELTSGAIANDKFTANLVPSEGDNGNLRKMQDIQTNKSLDEGESTLLDTYHNLNTNTGLKASTANRLSEIATLEKQSAQERIASMSGVNLDEEAANMMKFQQAYMASSRIMQAANETFDTILALR